MFDWLYNFPDLVIVFGLAILFAVLFGGMPYLRHLIFKGELDKGHADAASRALASVGGFTGFLLAFSLVQAQTNLRGVEKQVGAEAHDLNQADRLLVRYGDPATGPIRESLRAYAESIVSDEFPAMKEGTDSEKTVALFPPISRGIIALQPAAGRQSTLYSELVRVSDSLAEDRSQRLDAATNLRVPAIFWIVILTLFVIQVFFAFAIGTRGGGALGLAGQGFALALLMALVFIFDVPFKGQTSVSPEPIQQVIVEIKTRTS